MDHKEKQKRSWKLTIFEGIGILLLGFGGGYLSATIYYVYVAAKPQTAYRQEVLYQQLPAQSKSAAPAHRHGPSCNHAAGAK